MVSRVPRFVLVLVAGCGPADSDRSLETGTQAGADLLVFVGRRLAVQEVGSAVPPGQPFLIDAKFRARYAVLKVLWGAYHQRTIEFDVYDHYGTPAFTEYETVLLYVSRYNGRLVHEKYLYNPVYDTEDGRWAGCGDPYALDDVHRGDVRAKPLSFKHELTFSVQGMREQQIDSLYPQEYFQRRGDRVVCVKGASAEDLFAIKRAGFLRARGVFD